MYHFITVVDDYATWREGPIEDIDVATVRYWEEVTSDLSRIANAITLECYAVDDPSGMAYDRNLVNRPKELAFLKGHEVVASRPDA